jgi:OmpA-OmpF porin, OOP family
MNKPIFWPTTGLFLALALPLAAQITPNDGDWNKPLVMLKNTPEAEFMVRVGDVDNLNAGWPQKQDPFLGQTSPPHPFPWETVKTDPKGTDRIYVVTSFGEGKPSCGQDGYSRTTTKPGNRPTALYLPLKGVRETTAKVAVLQLMIDDFQAPTHCARYIVRLNGKRFFDLERLLNHVDLGGPVSKLITVRLRDNLLPLLKESRLKLEIDDKETGAGDGYAIDFVKLLVNPKPGYPKTGGNLRGRVLSKADRQPVPNAKVEVAGFGLTYTDAQGNFAFKNLPAGLNLLEVNAIRYLSKRQGADVLASKTDSQTEVLLDPGQEKTVSLGGRDLREGDTLVFPNIQFEQSQEELTKAAEAEMERLALAMKARPQMVVELAGHTSDEGPERPNQLLGNDRVRNCQRYLVRRGVEKERVLIIGYGSEKPLAPNTTPENRARNRRVEMKILRM